MRHWIFNSTLLLLAWSAATAAAAHPFYTVRVTDGMLLATEPTTGLTDEVGLLGVTVLNYKDLASLDGRLYHLAQLDDDSHVVYEISTSTGAVLSTLALTYDGSPVTSATGIAGLEGQLWLSFSPSSASNQDHVGAIQNDGVVAQEVPVGEDIDALGATDGMLIGLNRVAGGPRFYAIDQLTGVKALLFVGDMTQYNVNDVSACGTDFTIVDHQNLAIHRIDGTSGALLASDSIPGEAHGIAVLRDCGVFSDSFETGDLSSWSAVVTP